MKNKLIIIVVFIAGMITSLVLAKVIMSKQELLFKVLHKLEGYRIATIPKKKDVRFLYNFEKEQELNSLELLNSKAELVNEQATLGQSSAKFTIFPSGDASGFVIKKFFETSRKDANWEGYDSFALDIYNPQDKAMRAILKFKDQSGYNFQHDINLRPKSKNPVSVGIYQLRSKIKPSKISQVNLFFWKLNSEVVLYVDNVRLEPARMVDNDRLMILDEQYLPKRDEPIYKGKEYFNFAELKPKWTQGVPLYVNNPTDSQLNAFPVSGGVPFPQGELKLVSEISLFDQDKKPLVFQARPLGYWVDGSIKWAQIDTQLNMLSNQRQICYLDYGKQFRHPQGQSHLSLEEKGNSVIVDTGALKFEVLKKGFRLFDRVWVDINGDKKFSDNETVSKEGDLVLVRGNEEYRSSLDQDYTLTVEEKGPLKVTLKADGWFVSKKNNKYCKFIVRIQAFAGQSFVNVFHTFIYTGYPENKHHYLYKGKRLPKNETIDGIYIETPYALKGKTSYTLGVDNNSMTSSLNKNISIRQNALSELSIDADKKNIFKGSKAEGWLDVNNDNMGFSIIIKNLWEQFPKGWDLDHKKGMVRTQIWPADKGVIDLSTTANAYGTEAVARGSAFGLGKTHELSFYFHPGALSKETGWNAVKLLENTTLLSAVPEWIYDTNVIGKVVARLEKTKSPAEETLDLMFDWSERQIKLNQWYGMIDFGDVRALHEDHWLNDGRHGWMNNEGMGLTPGALMQYLRTAEQKYLEFGKNNAMHIMDVDTVHYNTVANDKRLKNRIPDDYSQVGSQHRHNADHWGDRNEETSHTNLHGTLLYYYMTGYERALDVAKEIGEFFLQERMTYFKHPDICPQRNIGNVLWGVTEMYETTRDERYKKVADKWADILFKGQRYDGTWGESYNPLTGTWEENIKTGFTLNYTLPALVAYHRVTGNKAAAEMIVNAVRYFVDEKPYNPFLEAAVYSYYLTGDPVFIDRSLERLEYYIHHQNKKDDPLMKGMIYQKAYYARPIEFLYQLPYGFESFVLDKYIHQARVPIEMQVEGVEGQAEGEVQQ